MSYRPSGAWRELAWLIGLGLVAVVVLVLAVFAAIDDDERCKDAGGRQVCHTVTVYGGKGIQYGTECRCLTADGREIVP